MRTFIAGISLLATLGLGPLWAEEPAPMFDVPRLDHIMIDGKADDWGDRGFRVAVLGDATGKLRPAANLDAGFRLGWDERGLLVLLTVTDDVADEAKNDSELYQRDSVEIFYAPQRGAPDVVQMVISPGVDPQRPELRSSLQDERHTEALKKTKATATAVRTKTANGYTLEVLLPWENFAISPAVGREVAFQLYVNDTDGGGGKFQAVWYPFGSGHDSMNMQRVRLADKPSLPVNALVTGEYERFRRVRVHVAATPEFLGKLLTVKEGARELGRVSFAPEDGRAGATVVLTMPAPGTAYGPLAVAADGQLLKTMNLPDPQAARAKAFMAQNLNFNPSVFSGRDFPKCEFERPSAVEDLIGPYTFTTTFYDADYQPVTTAEKPGRYGAVVEIKTEDGKTFQRMRTLFQTPPKFNWWRSDWAGSIEFPAESGINPLVAKEQTHSINTYLKWLVGESFSRGSASPALMAALYETKPGTPDAGVSEDFLACDRQWWVGLKRKLSGADKLYPQPFVCPQLVTDKPATMLHKGTLKEAGMKSGAPEAVDAVLRQWSADTDEAFAVCVARHGVIILHKAYGQRASQPMTVETKSRMASITKALSGTAMMMLVDQGLVNLDDPVAKFLPAFRGAKVATPLTIRHLYTHTSGLQEHWGDDLHDFEDIIAGYYPYLAVGKRFEYAGADLALGSKILETITGEALPQFYKHHLLDPLGCTHTDVANSSYDDFSTPLDIAKFGQMLLNRGSYGDQRFMRAGTFQQMLPERLTKLLGPDTTVEWGIGLVWYKDEGLGKGTFGHGAASGATLRVDPEHDLVIVMTRNAQGGNLAKYHPKFLAAIMENIAE